MIKVKAKFSGISVFSLIIAGQAHAQERRSDIFDDVIIVTANKHEENLDKVPISISAISGERLKSLGVASAADLEKVALGFNFRPSPQGSPVFQIRGIGFYEEAIAVAPAVSVYLDQAPLPFSSMAEGAAFDLERVEVLKGPQGTLFGQNVTGGAINYIAAKPTRTLTYGMNGSFSRFGAVEVDGFVSGPLSNTIAVRVSAKIERGGDWQRSYVRQLPDDSFEVDLDGPANTIGERRFDVGRFLMDWAPSDGVEIQLNINGWRNRSDTQAQQLLAVVPGDPDGIDLMPEWDQFVNFPAAPKNNRLAAWDPNRDFRRNDEFYQIAMNGRFELSDTLNLISISSYSNLDAQRPVDLDGTPVFNLFIENGGQLESVSQEFRLEGDQGPLRWMVGGNFEHNKTNELQHILFNATVPFTSADQKMRQKSRSWSGFFSFNYDFTPEFSLEASARYTWRRVNMSGCTADIGDGNFAGFVSSAFSFDPPIANGSCTTIDTITFLPGLVNRTASEDNVSWRTGLSWSPDDDTMLYANITKGFKAGNYVNVTAIFSDSLTFVPQESVLSLEAGFKLNTLDRLVQLNGAVFHYDYNNKQLTGFIDGGVFGALNSVVSIPDSRVRGFEFETILRPVRGLTLRGGVTYIDSQVTGDFIALSANKIGSNIRGESFPGTPKWALLGDAEYRFPVSDRTDSFVGVNVNYRSDSRTFFDADPRFDVPSYETVDVRAGILLLDGKYKFEVFGENIFD